MTQKNTLDDELKALLEEQEHAHHHHDHDEEHEHHHHDHDEEHEHHHHVHDEEHEHHHHEHDENCTCGCHDHDHEHHHHHADEVFTSWGTETSRAYTPAEIQFALEALENAEAYGTILRAKGIVAGTDGQWIHFDYVPGTPDVRTGCAATTGRLCVIGSDIHEAAIAQLFHAE
jgi:G3E family GTPase